MTFFTAPETDIIHRQALAADDTQLFFDTLQYFNTQHHRSARVGCKGDVCHSPATKWPTFFRAFLER
jgi:hypothetical protein